MIDKHHCSCGGCICGGEKQHIIAGEGIKEEIVKVVKKKGKPLLAKGKKLIEEKVIEPVVEKVIEKKMKKNMKQMKEPMEKVMEGTGVKKQSKWIEWVKKVAKDKDISYREAMKVAGATYVK